MADIGLDDSLNLQLLLMNAFVIEENTMKITTMTLIIISMLTCSTIIANLHDNEEYLKIRDIMVTLGETVGDDVVYEMLTKGDNKIVTLLKKITRDGVNNELIAQYLERCEKLEEEDENRRGATVCCCLGGHAIVVIGSLIPVLLAVINGNC